MQDSALLLLLHCNLARLSTGHVFLTTGPSLSLSSLSLSRLAPSVVTIQITRIKTPRARTQDVYLFQAREKWSTPRLGEREKERGDEVRALAKDSPVP